MHILEFVGEHTHLRLPHHLSILEIALHTLYQEVLPIKVLGYPYPQGIALDLEL